MSAQAVSTFRGLSDWLLTADADALAWADESRCAGWSNLDILVHLTCTLRELVEPETLPTPVPDDIERTNDVQVEQFRGLAARQAMAEYTRLLPGTVDVLRELQSESVADETFDLLDAGVYPVHLAADSLVFDHYCHLVHDVTLGEALSPCPAELAVEALSVSTGWLVAGIPQMSGTALAEAVLQPVTLELSGGGGGAWVLDRDGEGSVVVTPVAGGTAGTRHAIRSTTADFMLWGTHRVDWRRTEVRADDDPVTAAVVDAIHVF